MGDPRTVTLSNARVWTADPARPHATSVSFRDGGIVALDGPAPSEAIDMGGRWIGPAFIDAHLHLTLGAATLAQCDLSGCASRDEFERRIADLEHEVAALHARLKALEDALG